MDQVSFFMLMVLIALPSVVSGSIESWWEPIFESAMLMLAACSLVANNGRDWWQMPAVVTPIIGFIIFGCFQILPLWRSGNHLSAYEAISFDPFETKRFIVKLLVVVITLAMLSRYIVTRERLMILMNVIVLIGAFSALCAILRLTPAGSTNDLQSGMQEGFGQFANRNHFTLLMEMSIGPTVALVYLAATRISQILRTVALVLMVIALLSANSRGGFLSLSVQCTLLAWIVVRAIAAKFFGTFSFAFESSGKRLLSQGRLIAVHSVLLVFLFATVFAGFLWIGGERIRQRLETVPDELRSHASESQTSGTRRLEIWSATLGMIKAHPFLGSGLGAYKTAISGHFQPVNEWHPEQAHNEYLELIAGAGVVGAVLGLWFLAVIRREIKRRLSEDLFRQVVCLGGAVGLVGVAIHSLVDFGLHMMANSVIFTVLIALATFRFPPESKGAIPVA
ncbi:MAG TPA: O-antigen ligase family protein [Pyrinomonadaceae bacterium]|nr:O-antigen ligase family protein [Pyrinomonadaceae bacterium]